MDDDKNPVKSKTASADFPQLLAMAIEFRMKCPGILLGQHGSFFLDMEITGKLTLLSKLQANPNDAAQYQLSYDIIEHVEKLNGHLKEVGEDHPDEFNKLQQDSYYSHLEIIKLTLSVHQETIYPHLHSARHLITSLQQLKKFDPKEYGALHHLLIALEETFRDEKLPAYEKLKIMMQQVNYSYHAIKTTRALSVTFFGMQAKPNPLAPALETFIKEDMANVAKLNGISLKEEHTPSSSPTNTSRNP